MRCRYKRLARIVARRRRRPVSARPNRSRSRAGRLRLVLEESEPPPVPVSLVTLEGRRAAPRVRRLLDFAVERLRAERF
jgi:DNA-binding transcriptional LysR family regulator